MGGGVAGILAALSLKRTHGSVVLVERAPALGGLLRSVRAPDGTPYDFGTHVPAEADRGPVDELMLAPLRAEPGAWCEHRVLRAGNYFAGRLNADSPCIDARALPPDAYEKGVKEFLASEPPETPPAGLAEHLESFYGPTFAEAVFGGPTRKFFGRPASGLSSKAHALFFLPRLVALDPEETRRLKREPRYDRKLAFHSFRESPSSVRAFYPRAGGAGLWIEGLERSLRAAGVEVLTGESVASLAGGRARLASGRELDAAPLVWTTPVFECLKAAGVPPRSAPPDLRQTTLVHLAFDRPFATELQYLTVMDPRLASFRVTLYPSLRQEEGQSAPYNCTVELLDSPGAAAPSPDAVEAELAAMGLLAPGARRLDARVDRIPGGFPVMTPAFLASAAEQLEAARRALPGAVFVGKARGSAWFTPDVLRETQRELGALQGARA